MHKIEAAFSVGYLYLLSYSPGSQQYVLQWNTGYAFLTQKLFAVEGKKELKNTSDILQDIAM